MMRAKLLVLAATVTAMVIAAAGLASGASGGSGPTPWHIPPETVVADIPAADACPAATSGMTITYLGGNLTITNFPNGASVSGGVGQLKVTNTATGKFVVVPSAGYGYYGPQGNGFVNIAAGPDQLWTFNPGDAGPGDHSVGRVYLIAGVTSAQITADGVTVAFNYAGKIVEDVCTAIS